MAGKGETVLHSPVEELPTSAARSRRRELAAAVFSSGDAGAATRSDREEESGRGRAATSEGGRRSDRREDCHPRNKAPAVESFGSGLNSTDEIVGETG